MITITHSEISSVAAGRLGSGATAESVSKTVKQYAECAIDLMKEKGPTNPKDVTLVETPLVGYEISYHENGVRKNADGTEEKIGPNRTVKTAIPNALIKGINADLIKLVANVVKAVVDVKKAA